MKFNNKKYLSYAVLAVLILLPLVVRNSYQVRLLNLAGIYLLLTLGLQIVVGFTGQMSFAQAAFYGIGAYISALLSVRLGLPFLICLPLAGLGAALFGIVLGIPSLQVSGHYLAVVTMGFCEIVRLILLNWTPVTYGAEGIKNIPPPEIFGYVIDTQVEYYYLILVLCVLSVIVVYRIQNSRMGRALTAIRTSDLAAEIMGINSYFYKVFAFALSGFFGGIAGSLIAHYELYINPTSFSFFESAKILCMLFIGGSSHVAGSIIGSTLLTILPEYLRFMKDYYMAVYGIGVTVLMIYMPKGITGYFDERLSERKQSIQSSSVYTKSNSA